jgi:hypothetical protein
VTVPLACVYVVNLKPEFVRMGLTSLASLRRFDPDVQVVIKIADHPDCMANQNEQTRRFLAMADAVDLVPPAAGDYFGTNRMVLRDIDAERIVFIDADTIFFGSVRALNQRFARFDLAACPSPWVWQYGYQRRFAPDIYQILNAGLVAMTRRFAQTWGTVNATRPTQLLVDPARATLVNWLRSVSKNAWFRGDLTLSELAWNGNWSVGLLDPRDCYLLSRWPNEEDPTTWLSSTVLHTYSHLWCACIARLHDIGWVDPACAESPSQG